MLKAKFLAVAALAAAMVVTASTSAEAFCHKYRSVPVWYGVYYPNCGPCGGCIMPYVASGAYCGYGYCGIGCCGYGCGYGCNYGCGAACGTGCGYGCGPCVRKHGCLAAHKAWKRYLRGCGSCFDSCGCYGGCSSCYGGCSDCSGSCDGCGSGTGGCSSCNIDSGEVISDGPAPAEAGVPSMPDDQSASVRRPLVLLAGMRTKNADGSAEFSQGLSEYRGGSLNDAARDFEAAAAAEPDNALYHYYRALTMHDLYGAAAGEEALSQAVEAERREPVKGWGRRMERVQGSSRVWIEKARREAGLVR